MADGPGGRGLSLWKETTAFLRLVNGELKGQGWERKCGGGRVLIRWLRWGVGNLVGG